MSTLERSWQSSLNITYTPVSSVDRSRRIMWSIKALLKGELGGLTGTGLWTHYGSSDGVTAGLDATDRWTNAYDGTKITRAAAGSAHSWIVLQSPVLADGTCQYLIIDFSSGADAATKFIWSKSAPTGGTTLNRPTATDEMVNYQTSAQTTLQDTTFAVNDRINFGLSSTGDFWLCIAKVGAQQPFFAMIGACLGSTPVDSTYNFWSYAGYTAGAVGAFSHTMIANAVTTVGAAGSVSLMRHPNGSALLPAAPMLPCYQSNLGSAATLFIGDSALAGAVRAYDAFHGTYLDWPVQIVSVQNESPYLSWGYRGRLVDFAFGSTQVTGRAEPVGGPYNSAIIGDLWLPLGSSAAVPTFP